MTITVLRLSRARTDHVGLTSSLEVAQLPRGGLRSNADMQAYQDQSFVLRGTLPATWPKGGRVAWARGESRTRPLTGVDESYNPLAGGRKGGKPYLTVTEAKLGEMRVDTSCRPAVVPAWLFTLEGYDSPPQAGCSSSP